MTNGYGQEAAMTYYTVLNQEDLVIPVDAAPSPRK